MIAVIATVLNEGDNIDRLMTSLCQQTLPPTQVVIVDGGSQDDTVKRMEAYRTQLNLTLIVKAGCNISEGRNLAIQHATEDIIAITDAGVILPDTWLETITRPLRENPTLTVSAGFFEADTHNLFEIAMGATVLPLAHEIDPQTFLPSSRSVAVRRSAIQAVGGYPEWLDYCEDLIFDLRLKATQPPFAFVPEASVKFRPRPTLRKFYKQYYLYARGDGKADLWLKRHLIRYLTYVVALPTLLIGMGLGMSWLVGLVIGGGVVYCFAPLQRLPYLMKKEAGVGAWVQVVLWIPIIRLVGDVAKMVGYPVGRMWRWRNHPPDWQLPVTPKA